MLDLIRKRWRLKVSGQFNEFKKKIKNRVSQVIDGHIENQEGGVNPVDLLSVASTSYILSVDSELTYFDSNVADENEKLENSFQEKEQFSRLLEFYQRWLKKIKF